jgi:hypothetical protein
VAIAAGKHVHGGLFDEDYGAPSIVQLIDKGFIMIASQILDRIDLGNSTICPVIGERRDAMLLANSSEYKEGEVAFSRGLTARNNPYPFGSSEYWRWSEGLFGNCHPSEEQ